MSDVITSDTDVFLVLFYNFNLLTMKNELLFEQGGDFFNSSSINFTSNLKIISVWHIFCVKKKVKLFFLLLFNLRS